MIFKNSQDDIEFNDVVIPSGYTRIGIKLSGGADSAIVCYMLAKYCKEERPEITIHPITSISEGKEYNLLFAGIIVNTISELLDFDNFGKHYYRPARTTSSEDYVNDQNSLLNDLYKEGKLDMHFAGITANPRIEDAPHLFTNLLQLPSDDRSRGVIKKPQFTKHSSLPLINTDKRGVAEHYINLGLMDSLFPVTRSCESFTDNFARHCGVCWFCKERLWGFGRYV